ncbi:hypothetical protein SRHO_G00197340 [Serrasalmus rhombeus]
MAGNADANLLGDFTAAELSAAINKLKPGKSPAGFHRGRSTVDQVTLLTQDIEDNFQDNEKAGVVFLDLTATYDTWLLADYVQKWQLQPSVGKTVAAAYHLNNQEARRELDVYVGKNRLEFQQAPRYLGVCFDWTLSYKQHLDEVKAKVTARVSLIRCLAGSTWGASPQTLRISTQALVLPAAEYCAHMSTCEQGRYCHQQRPPDSNWLSETHPCVLPASPCWNRPS